MEIGKKQSRKPFAILLVSLVISNIYGTATVAGQQPVPILELVISDKAQVVDYDNGIYVVGTSGGNLYIINEAGEYTVTALGAGSILDVRIENCFLAVAAGSSTILKFFVNDLTPEEQWRRSVDGQVKSVDTSCDGAYVAYLSRYSVGVFNSSGTLVSSYSISGAGIVWWLDATCDMEYIAITAEVPPYSGTNSGVELYRFDGNNISRQWGNVLINKYETTEVRVSEAKDYVAVATSSGTYMNFLDLPTGDLLWRYETPDKEQYACDGDDNLEYVIGANQGWAIPYHWFVLKNLDTSYEVIASGDMNGPINDLDSNPDSSLLAFGSDIGEFILLRKWPDDTNGIILSGNVGKLIDAIEIGDISLLVGGQTFIDLYALPSSYVELRKFYDVNYGSCVGPIGDFNYTISYIYHGYTTYLDINDVNIIDSLPDEVEFVSSVPGPNEIIDSNFIWHIGTLHPGDAGFITLKVRVKESVSQCGSIINRCELRSGEQILINTSEYTAVCVKNSIVVDDFESYGSNEELKNVWKDYWSNGTCAEVFTNQTTVCNGQSMQYLYENYTYWPYYSEANATVASLGLDPNWLGMGAKALVLWFYGLPINPPDEAMYIKLTDGSNVTGKVIYNVDMNDISEPKWHEWNIDLQKFVDNNNVNLADVNIITIGFGDGTKAASDGTVYFDDIQLCVPRCILSKRSPDFALVDYAPPGSPAGDCVIDYQELVMMVDDWLGTECCEADLYKDDKVDFKDFAILANNWFKEELFP